MVAEDFMTCSLMLDKLKFDAYVDAVLKDKSFNIKNFIVKKKIANGDQLVKEVGPMIAKIFSYVFTRLHIVKNEVYALAASYLETDVKTIPKMDIDEFYAAASKAIIYTLPAELYARFNLSKKEVAPKIINFLRKAEAKVIT